MKNAYSAPVYYSALFVHNLCENRGHPLLVMRLNFESISPWIFASKLVQFFHIVSNDS